jgi:hypothetical protein
MSLSRIVLRLARNPGTEFAGGDDHRGYALTAPLTEDGHLDETAFSKVKGECSVRRFAPDEDAVDGRLNRRGARWFFDYDNTDDADDEPSADLQGDGGHAGSVRRLSRRRCGGPGPSCP